MGSPRPGRLRLNGSAIAIAVMVLLGFALTATASGQTTVAACKDQVKSVATIKLEPSAAATAWRDGLDLYCAGDYLAATAKFVQVNAQAPGNQTVQEYLRLATDKAAHQPAPVPVKPAQPKSGSSEFPAWLVPIIAFVLYLVFAALRASRRRPRSLGVPAK